MLFSKLQRKCASSDFGHRNRLISLGWGFGLIASNFYVLANWAYCLFSFKSFFLVNHEYHFAVHLNMVNIITIVSIFLVSLVGILTYLHHKFL